MLANSLEEAFCNEFHHFWSKPNGPMEIRPFLIKCIDSWISYPNAQLLHSLIDLVDNNPSMLAQQTPTKHHDQLNT